MSTIVLLEMHVKPEAVNEVKASLKSLLPDTRAYAGCRKIDIYENLDTKGTIVVHELWDSRDHYQRYLAWRTETGVMAQLVAKLTEPPSIRYFERLDI